MAHPEEDVLHALSTDHGEAEEAGEGEDGMMDRAAEAAAHNPRARPVVIGVASRQIARQHVAGTPAAHRRAVVRHVNIAPKTLTRAGGRQAIRALPKIVASVNRTADARGGSPIARAAIPRRAMSPVILVGGALSGIFTTTEAGGVAVLYTLAPGCAVFRRLGREEIWQALLVTARISASIYLVLAAPEILSYAMTTAGISAWVRDQEPMFAGHPTLFIYAAVLFLIGVGAVLEPGPAILIFVPPLSPVARSMGIDPLQFPIVFVLTSALGLSTPPIGLCLFIARKIGRIAMGKLFGAPWLFFVAEKLVVVLLVLVPWCSTWLVHVIRR